MALVKIQHAGDVDLVTQDAWVAIARGLGRLDDPACFPRWAFRILERRAADWVRRRQAERQRTAAWQHEHEMPVGCEGGAPHRDAATDRIAQVVANLEAEARELVYLFYHAERSVAEIATILGVPAGTVKSRLFKVRETIKQQIERTTDERLG
jgi:RNA polymerase sigma factor (sigma-70 family)